MRKSWNLRITSINCCYEATVNRLLCSQSILQISAFLTLLVLLPQTLLSTEVTWSQEARGRWWWYGQWFLSAQERVVFGGSCPRLSGTKRRPRAVASVRRGRAVRADSAGYYQVGSIPVASCPTSPKFLILGRNDDLPLLRPWSLVGACGRLQISILKESLCQLYRGKSRGGKII